MLAALIRSPGNAVIDDIPEPGPPLAGWAVVRPDAAGIRGSDCNIIPAIPPVLSGARDYCPRIPGHEFSAVSTEHGSAAPSALAPECPPPGMPARNAPRGLRECLGTAASTASGADDPGYRMRRGRASRRRSWCPPPRRAAPRAGERACDQRNGGRGRNVMKTYSDTGVTLVPAAR